MDHSPPSLTPRRWLGSLPELGPDAWPHLLPPRPVICMHGRAVEPRGAHWAGQTVALFVGAGYATRGTVMTSWKKSKVLAQITSFTLSCELPAVCECTTDKLYREGLLFWGGFHRSALSPSALAIFAETKKVMENIVRWVCVYIWSTCKCSAVHNGCFLLKKPTGLSV